MIVKTVLFVNKNIPKVSSFKPIYVKFKDLPGGRPVSVKSTLTKSALLGM